MHLFGVYPENRGDCVRLGELRYRIALARELRVYKEPVAERQEDGGRCDRRKFVIFAVVSRISLRLLH